MYKNNSRNMQGRASRIDTADIPPEFTDLQEYMADHCARREALAKRVNDLQNRVTVLKARLGVASRVQHKEIRGMATRTQEYREWGRLIHDIADLQAQLKAMPRCDLGNWRDHMLDLLRELFPEVFDRVRKVAISKAQAELKKIQTTTGEKK